MKKSIKIISTLVLIIEKMADYSDQKTDAVLKRVAKLASDNAKKPKLYFECGNVSPTEIGMENNEQ